MRILTKRSRFALGLVLIGPALVAANLPAQARVALRADVPEIVAAVARSAGSAAAAWPGFTTPSEYVLCQKDELTVLVSNEAPGTELGVAPTHSIDVEHAPSLHVYAGRLAELPPNCFTLRFSYRANQLLSFPLLDSAYSVRDPARATASAVLHEWFHAYQRTAFRGTLGAHRAWRFDVHEQPLAIPFDVMESARFQDGAQHERALLAVALVAPSSDSTRRVLRRYVAERADRMRLLTPELRGGEPHEERKEGTAHYAAYRTVFGNGDAFDRDLQTLVRADLLERLDFSRGAVAAGRSWRSWHIYATGAAIGLVLDKLGCDWRGFVASGYSFFAVLAEALGDTVGLDDVLTPLPPKNELKCGGGTR